MKSTGIVRKLDELGRIVIPMELRRERGIGQYTPMEIFVEGDDIILRKYVHTCALCGSLDELLDVDGKNVCRTCAEQFVKALKEV